MRLVIDAGGMVSLAVVAVWLTHVVFMFPLLSTVLTPISRVVLSERPVRL